MLIRVPRFRKSLLFFLAVFIISFFLIPINPNACDVEQPDNDDANPVAAMPRGIAINSDTSQAVYISGHSNSVKIYDLINREIIATVHVGREPNNVAIDKNMNLALISNSEDNTVSLLDLSSERVIDTIKTGHTPAGISIDQKKHIALVTNLRDDSVTVIDLNTRQVVATVPTGNRPIDAAIYDIDDNDSIGLVVNRKDRNLSVIDLSSFSPINTFNAGITPRAIDINQETGLAIVTDVLTNAITVIDLRTFYGRVIGAGKRPIDAAFNTVDNRVVVISETEQKLYLIDVETNDIIKTYNLHAHGRGVAVDSKLNLAAVVDKNSDKLIIIPLPYATPMPTIKIESPKNNEQINSSTVTVTGKVTNAATVSVNGVAASVAGSSFSAQISLKEGINTITATVVDAYGRTASQSISVTAHVSFSLKGNVTNSITGMPLSAAEVSIVDGKNKKQTVLTDANGNYRIDNIITSATGTISKLWYVTFGFAKDPATDPVVTVDIALLPVPPIITELTATDITTEPWPVTRITWKTDQPSDSTVEYQAIGGYGYGGGYGGYGGGEYTSTNYDGTLVTSHSMDLSVNPSTTYSYTVKSTGENGATGVSSGNQFLTRGKIFLYISTPYDGSTIKGTSVLVSGSVINTTMNVPVVKVNGVAASVAGNQFVLNNVPLIQGTNTITVTATDDAAELSATQTATVNATVPTNYLAVTVTPQSGILPLNATLSIEGISAKEDVTIVMSGPQYSADIPASSLNSSYQYSTQLNTPGLYTFTVSKQDQDGDTIQATAMVEVLSQQKIDASLQSKWTAMNNALRTGDLTTALNLVVPDYRPNYQIVFNLLKDKWPDIISMYRGISLVSVYDNLVIYKLSALKNGEKRAYEIRFVKYTDGEWYFLEY